MVSTEPAVEATGLVKRYGDITALGGLDLAVDEGSVHALLGPNGAGKTTAVGILSTLVAPDEGSAKVAGIDVLADPGQVRRRIGLSGQYAAVDEVLTGYENLEMIGRLYRMSKAEARARARELLERFDLVEAGDRPVKGYSGGMRRRLDLAGALVAEPPVLFLDEPTTGLDPRSRIELWVVIRELVAKGSTLLLSTQYLEEADQLADRIVVIDHGRSIAEGTPAELKARVGGERIEITMPSPDQLDAAAAALAPLAAGAVETDRGTRRVLAPVAGGPETLAKAVGLLGDRAIVVSEIGLRLPTLDEVFLTLTHDESGAPGGAVHDARGTPS